MRQSKKDLIDELLKDIKLYETSLDTLLHCINKVFMPYETVYYCKNEECVIKLLNNCKETTGLSFNGAQDSIETLLERLNMFQDFNCLAFVGENEVQAIHSYTLQYCKDNGYNIVEITE